MSYCIQVFNLKGECMFQSDDVGIWDTTPTYFRVSGADGDESAIWLFPWSSLSEVRIWEEKDE